MPWISLILFVVLVSACQPVLEEVDSAETQSDETLTQSASFPREALMQISGKLRYEDRLYSRFGFNEAQHVLRPIRNMRAFLVDINGEVVVEFYTDQKGEFLFDLDKPGDYRVRLPAATVHPDTYVSMQVKNLSSQVYAIEQAVSLNESNTEIEMIATVENKTAGIFNMLDVFSLGLDFYHTLNVNNSALNDINVYWEWGAGTGSFTCAAYSNGCYLGAGIYILSDHYNSKDSDEFDDDVLLHELAHHIEHSQGMFDSPAGAHNFSDRTLDVRLAWSEGMASAFSLSVKKWLSQHYPNHLSAIAIGTEEHTNFYIDTVADEPSAMIDMYRAVSEDYRSISNEVAVTASILRMQALNNSQRVWSELWNGLSTNSVADSMDAFWDIMVIQVASHAQVVEQWSSVLRPLDIFYFLDAYENDDNSSVATSLSLNTPVHRTLYRGIGLRDEDWYRVYLQSGVTYRFETYNLTNASDTWIELYDIQGNRVAYNDDATECVGMCKPLHNGTNFASMIRYQAPVSGTYFLRVKSADFVYDQPEKYGYFGRYGGYSIRYNLE